MNPIIPCPRCGLRLSVPEVHLGKKIRCRGCGTVIDTSGVDPDEVALGPEDEWHGGDAPPLKLGVRVDHDPSGRLEGAYPAELVPEGLRLTRRDEAVLIPVGAKVETRGGNRIAVPLEGRVVTLAVSRMGSYPDRLAQGVADFLARRAGLPVVADYAIPRALMVLALLPVGIMGVAIQGGMIGGAIGGAFAGSLLALNLGVVRKERWPVATRVGACLGVNAAGYAVLVLVLVALSRGGQVGNAPAPEMPPAPPPIVAGPPEAIAKPPGVIGPVPPVPAPRATAWGTPEDPLGDCRFDIHDNFATIEVPGKVHDLGAGPGRDKAPRIMGPAEGDFVAEVRVIGEVRPTEPPAPTSDVAFQGAGLLLHGQADGLIRLERAAFVRGLDLRGYILFEHHRPGLPMDAQVGECPVGPVALRLERRGASVVGSYTADGTTWRRLRPVSFGEARPTVGVAAVNTAAAPFLAEFEGFKLTRP